MKADPKTERAILQIIKDSWKAYENQDIEKVLSYYSTDLDSINFGTGADEKYIGMDALREGFSRDFSQSEGASVEFLWTSVSASGNVAWLAAECMARVKTAEGECCIPGRLTVVLENRDGRWWIMQSHFSNPASSQQDGQSFPQA